MKAAFYKVTAFKKGDAYGTFSTYLKDKLTIDRHMQWLSKEGYTNGHISKYIDMGTCYLIDLKWGDNGFVDFDIESEYTVYQAVNPIIWD